MAAITIRKLDDVVVARLKARAKAVGRSMEEEARAILTRETLGGGRLRGEAAVEYLRQRREQFFGETVVPDTTALLRSIRERDPEDVS
jgi:plasmid stability protein